MKTVLITGAYGFLGRHTSAYFKARGCRVIGMGHGCWEGKEAADYGIDLWIQGNICNEKLTTIEEPVNCIIHCAGSSSVGHSFQDPWLDFEKTVSSTIQILDFIRAKNPGSKLLYPSSGAVYGAQPDKPIDEITCGQPASPYGIHKSIVENLCYDYSNLYGISISVVRFFSLYGPCLRKQLLWDACEKIYRADQAVTFFGTGNETRDWLHVGDAAALLYCLFESKSSFEIYNGGAVPGIR
jgi:UDP-glucose 4-epimerase